MCHAPRLAEVYAETFRVMKPGALFVSSDWCLLDAFRASDVEHSAARFEVEVGSAVYRLRAVTEIEDQLGVAGFAVEDSFDSGALGDPGSPWYRPLTPGLTSLQRLRMYRPVQVALRRVIVALAATGRVPEDSPRVSDLLLRCAKGLVRAGELGIVTPMWCTIARRP